MRPAGVSMLAVVVDAGKDRRRSVGSGAVVLHAS